MKQLERLSLYQVDSIEGSRVDERGRRFYLIKWKDWEDKFNTWEPLCHLTTVKGLIQDYENRVEKQTETIEVNYPEQPKQEIQKGRDKERRGSEGKKPKKERQEGGKEKAARGLRKGQGEQAQSKRKRGRPPAGEAARLLMHNKKKLGKLSDEQQAQASKKEAQINRQTLSPIAELPEPIAGQKKAENALKVKSAKKRKPIHKSTARPNVALRGVNKKQQQASLLHEDALSLSKQMDIGFIDEEQSEGIEQVLLRCRNYTSVKVAFREGTFFYEVPFRAKGKASSMVLRAEEIIKINPKWLEGYFQGFHL